MFTAENFALWLHGFFELTDATELTPAQVAMIKEHLGLVFNKVTKPLERPTPPPTKMLWEGEDPRKYKAEPRKRSSDNPWILTEEERKELDDLQEKILKMVEQEDLKEKTSKELQQEFWEKIIKEMDKIPHQSEKLLKPYSLEKSPYNGTTPKPFWTGRFPQNFTFCANSTIC